MTDRPAFSDIPQGSKTGTGFVHDPESEAFIAECAEEELLPAEEWCRRLGYIILDPDGWRGRHALPWETPITKDDFVARAWKSTCAAWPVQDLYPNPQPEPEPPPKADPATFGRSLPEWARRRRTDD
jgi:hypothetical protein